MALEFLVDKGARSSVTSDGREVKVSLVAETIKLYESAIKKLKIKLDEEGNVAKGNFITIATDGGKVYIGKVATESKTSLTVSAAASAKNLKTVQNIYGTMKVGESKRLVVQRDASGEPVFKGDQVQKVEAQAKNNVTFKLGEAHKDNAGFFELVKLGEEAAGDERLNTPKTEAAPAKPAPAVVKA